jgi:hypothetical protein
VVKVLEYYIETQASLQSGRQFGLHHYLVNQMEGVHTGMEQRPSMTMTMF